MVEEGILFDPKKDWTKEWHWWDWLEHWWHIYFWNWFSEIPNNTKWFFQRGKRGWSNSDVWEMNYYLTKIILEMLTKLQRIKSGYPSTCNEKTGEWGYDEERWNKILQEMIDGFTILRKVDFYEEFLEYAPEFPDDKRTNMENNMRKNYPKWRFVTREEEARVKRAFELLYKYYCNLWD